MSTTVTPLDPEQLWSLCLARIEAQVRPQVFNTWFRHTQVRRFDRDALVLEVSGSYSAEFLESRYLDLIRHAIHDQTGLTPRISFATAPCGGGSSGQPLPETPAVDAERPTQPSLFDVVASPETPATPSLFGSLIEQYTFDNFVIGEGNRFAHAAALGVAQAPGKTQYNPLVIYGGVGLGKTHLLQAIGHHALHLARATKVAFVPSEKFMSDFIEAIKNQSTAEFRTLYRSPDILLVDDIQFLLRGERTQDEFFHTFNALYQRGKQIVMTCDSPPGQLQGMEERLVSRFKWGLVAPIEPPDLETRIAILHQKAEVNGIQLPDEVAVFLGNHISSNIRELEGALFHLMAFATVNRVELTVETARHIVQERGPAQAPLLTIRAIQQHVASHFSLSPETLVGKTRRQDVARARQVAMFLAKELTRSPLKAIGQQFGNRDHSTVVHAIQTVQRRAQQDPGFAQHIESLLQEIRLRYPA
ncbi:MAG: chromosomal replication initiator protein DnaA [Candidatus Latescibacterota bacterium]